MTPQAQITFVLSAQSPASGTLNRSTRTVFQFCPKRTVVARAAADSDLQLLDRPQPKQQEPSKTQKTQPGHAAGDLQQNNRQRQRRKTRAGAPGLPKEANGASSSTAVSTDRTASQSRTTHREVDSVKGQQYGTNSRMHGTGREGNTERPAGNGRPALPRQRAQAPKREQRSHSSLPPRPKLTFPSNRSPGNSEPDSQSASAALRQTLEDPDQADEAEVLDTASAPVEASKESEATASSKPQSFSSASVSTSDKSAPHIQGPPQRKPLPTRRPPPAMYRQNPQRVETAVPRAAQTLEAQPAPPAPPAPGTDPAARGGKEMNREEDRAEPDDTLAEPQLNAKPIARRPPVKKQQKPYIKDEVRAFRRMPSELRTNQFERPSKDVKDQYSSAWRDRAQKSSQAAPAPQLPDAGKQAPAGKPRQSGRRKAVNEKQDIEKQRASRQERRQQRQEQLRARAREQEEIFEVGSEGMSVGELADRLAVNGGDVLKALFMKGIMAQVNQVLDKQMVKVVAEEYGVEVLDIEEQGVDVRARKTEYDEEDDLEMLVSRPPVVTVMGHVDHGKTSLLDYMRKSKVAAGEAGGITQAIGAYTVDVEGADTGPKQITFLDTPGHEAFSAMRARGAKVTDVAVIVLACDDGVRPQTREAISHAKAANVPIVVALNKIDKEGANVERAMQEMNEAGLLPEEWGGDTPFVPISAKKGTGIDSLLETLLLVAEVGELTANPDRQARGSVVEAHLDRRMGPVATLLVAAGTLRVGDVIHAGAVFGKVRNMTDSRGQSVEEAGPSIAVQLVGLNSVPVAGDEFAAVETEQEARKIASAVEDIQRISRLAEQAGGSMVTGMTLATYDEEGDALQYLNLVLKADASGSVEAIKASLLRLPQDRVSLRFLMAAAGEITSSDVQLAYASEGRILGFKLEPSEAVQALAKQYGVIIKSYDVIYELLSDVRELMEGRLGAVEERLPLGQAEVRAVFGAGSKKVAGCIVTEGSLKKGCLIAVSRGKQLLHEGKLTSLRRVKENVAEVSNGNECGVGVEGFSDWRDGDTLQAFDVKSKKQTLEEASESLPSMAL